MKRKAKVLIAILCILAVAIGLAVYFFLAPDDWRYGDRICDLHDNEIEGLNELGKVLGPAIEQEFNSQLNALGLFFCFSSLLIIIIARKVWELKSHLLLVVMAGIVVTVIGCVRFVLEYSHLDTHLHPFAMISSLLLWFFILAICGYGWRKGFLLSLLLSFSYNFWIGVYECFL